MAEGTFIKLIQNGKKPVMSTVIIQTEMLRRVCDRKKEREINANAEIGNDYVLVGRQHEGDMEEGWTTIYEAKLEIIDQATGKKINGLKAEISAPTVFCKPGHGECGDWGETQFDGSSTNRVITSYRHYTGNNGSDHAADENHGFTLLVAEIKLKSTSTGQYITLTPFDQSTWSIGRDSDNHIWTSQPRMWTKWWKGYGKGDENSRTDYGGFRLKSTSQINLADYGASLAE